MASQALVPSAPPFLRGQFVHVASARTCCPAGVVQRVAQAPSGAWFIEVQHAALTADAAPLRLWWHSSFVTICL